MAVKNPDLEVGDSVIISLDAGQPVEISDLTDSFAALARMYERHYRKDGEGAPRLYVTRLETGSIIAEIAPFAIIMGGLVATMDGGIIVADFTNRIWRAIKAFSDPHSLREPAKVDRPTPDDAKDVRAFIRPLEGRPGAKLGVKHARMEKRDGEREIVVEYTFDEQELNRAALNIDHSATDPLLLTHEAEEGERHKYLSEVMMFFEQASRAPGKEKGRTADKGIIPDMTDKALPVYFRKSFQGLKEQMVKGEINPLTNAFVVDASVQIIGQEPKAYIITNVHETVPLDDD